MEPRDEERGAMIGFASPLVLLALAGLPALWWLMRITPPRPREVPFPPLKLVLDVEKKEEQPAKTPLWLLILRMAAAALLILAMAGPAWNPPTKGDEGKGPLLVLIDDTWAAAPRWEDRVAFVARRLAAAGRDGRPTALAPLSEGGREILAADWQKTTERLRALKPQPRRIDRAASLAALGAFVAAQRETAILWMSDGVAHGDARGFAEKLAGLAQAGVEIVAEAAPPRALAGPENAPSALTVRVLRPTTGGPEQGALRAVDLRGLTLGEATFDFAGATETQGKLDLPIELRNEIARLEIVGEKSAGAAALLDDRWKRRRVAVVSGVVADVAQPLLSPTYYLSRALGPFADVREQKGEAGRAIVDGLADNPSIVALADVGVVSGEAHDRLAKFVEEGGVLLRFAGVRLAGASDDLIPVRLRRGGRILGGALSWDKPKTLAGFTRESPFNGLTAPAEVTATRQVLAEPEPGLPAKTWAALADGTPLVTAERRGKGLIVLFHVTADTTWSNLPLSGLFVDMLRRIVAMSGQTGAQAEGTGASGERAETMQSQVAAPTRTLDGFGVFGAPPPTARPIPVDYAGDATAEHPPGFYGPPEALIAVNVLGPAEKLAPLDLSGLAVRTESLTRPQPIDLRAPALLAALALLIADILASLWLSGLIRRPARRAAAAGLVLLAFAALAPPDPAAAQAPAAPGVPPAPAAPRPPLSQRDLEAALTTRLAYVVTGDARLDEASKLGLAAVSRALRDRTSLVPGEPVGVDPGRDELTFYPLIYWPVAAGRPQPPAAAAQAIGAFMKQGGTVVFDTRDAMSQRPGGPPTPEAEWLRTLLTGVDVPALEPVPRDHVVTKTFYLLEGFVGRTTIGQTWIEALAPETAEGGRRPARSGDSVSPIVITSNDLAAAWAEDARGEPLYPLVPGGRRQRELALRGGVNLVMYTLTGNYKADQVHVKDLLERLAN